MGTADFGSGFGFNQRSEVFYRVFHDRCTAYYLRKKHFAGAEQLSYMVHARHEPAVDHGYCGTFSFKSGVDGVFQSFRNPMFNHIRESGAGILWFGYRRRFLWFRGLMCYMVFKHGRRGLYQP